MALRPIGLRTLVARAFVFPNTPVEIHGRRAAAPLGPSAGPHTQLAQNIVLAWLAGARVMELKTVQVLDAIVIPRPCIDARTVGYNVEWSQELTVDQSLEEYVKASMLIDLLAHFFGVDRGTLFDVSVGYDLAGIRSERVVAFLRGMIDARPAVARLRRLLPPQLRDAPFTTDIASGATLSTFHGCPPARPGEGDRRLPPRQRQRAHRSGRELAVRRRSSDADARRSHVPAPAISRRRGGQNDCRLLGLLPELCQAAVGAAGAAHAPDPLRDERAARPSAGLRIDAGVRPAGSHPSPPTWTRRSPVPTSSIRRAGVRLT